MQFAGNGQSAGGHEDADDRLHQAEAEAQPFVDAWVGERSDDGTGSEPSSRPSMYLRTPLPILRLRRLLILERRVASEAERLATKAFQEDPAKASQVDLLAKAAAQLLDTLAPGRRHDLITPALVAVFAEQFTVASLADGHGSSRFLAQHRETLAELGRTIVRRHVALDDLFHYESEKSIADAVTTRIEMAAAAEPVHPHHEGWKILSDQAMALASHPDDLRASVKATVAGIASDSLQAIAERAGAIMRELDHVDRVLTTLARTDVLDIDELAENVPDHVLGSAAKALEGKGELTGSEALESARLIPDEDSAPGLDEHTLRRRQLTAAPWNDGRKSWVAGRLALNRLEGQPELQGQVQAQMKESLARRNMDLADVDPRVDRPLVVVPPKEEARELDPRFDEVSVVAPSTADVYGIAPESPLHDEFDAQVPVVHEDLVKELFVEHDVPVTKASIEHAARQVADGADRPITANAIAFLDTVVSKAPLATTSHLADAPELAARVHGRLETGRVAIGEHAGAVARQVQRLRENIAAHTSQPDAPVVREEITGDDVDFDLGRVEATVDAGEESIEVEPIGYDLARSALADYTTDDEVGSDLPDVDQVISGLRGRVSQADVDVDQFGVASYSVDSRGFAHSAMEFSELGGDDSLTAQVDNGERLPEELGQAIERQGPSLRKPRSFGR